MMMHGVMILYEVPLLYYQVTTNSAVNRTLACVINNWNSFSKCLWTNKVIHIFCMLNEVLIWFKIKINDNFFNLLGIDL